MIHRGSILAGVLAGLLLPVAGAGGQQRPAVIGIDDLFALRRVGVVRAAPGGRRAVYELWRWDAAADGRIADLWLVTAAGAARRLTFDRVNDTDPRWSPDGAFVYFMSRRRCAREGAPSCRNVTQVWRVPAAGGAARAVTDPAHEVRGYRVSPDGAVYYVTTGRRLDADPKRALRRRFGKLNYGHGVNRRTIVWRFDPTTRRTEIVLDLKRPVAYLEISPNGRRIAVVVYPDPTILSYATAARIEVHDRTSGERTVVTPPGWRAEHPSPYGFIAGLTWSPDGRSLAFRMNFDGHPGRIYVADAPPGGTTLRRLPLPDALFVAYSAKALHWTPAGDALCFLAHEKALRRLFCLDARPGSRAVPAPASLSPPGHHVGGFHVAARTGRVFYTAGTARIVGDVFALRQGHRAQRLTRVNAHAANWALPRVTTVRWRGAGGDRVEGILDLPPGRKPGTPLPMIVHLHGGPNLSSFRALDFSWKGRALLAARGYAVFSPNYRGSTGYGAKFITALNGRQYDIEVTDVLRGVEAMVARGIADPNAIGVVGWSFGGYLAVALLTKSRRFKAASVGAAMIDSLLHWSSTDAPPLPIVLNGGLPWRRPGAYRASSPLFNFGAIRTPTLIHAGANDRRVSPIHSRALYRALWRTLKVPAELLIYPGEAHGLGRLGSVRAKLTWDLAWFDHYLRGKPFGTIK